jgi:hypothetical protein
MSPMPKNDMLTEKKKVDSRKKANSLCFRRASCLYSALLYFSSSNSAAY